MQSIGFCHDEGRKFPLARLRYSKVNWPSENSNTDRLDGIQSLKAFVTGDPLSAEIKGKDEEEFDPGAISLFNVNDTPNMTGRLEAFA
jgi:putative DNA primase/helicase